MRLKKYQVEKAIKGMFRAKRVSSGTEDIGGFIFSYFKLQIGSVEKSLEWGFLRDVPVHRTWASVGNVVHVAAGRMRKI
jgi:hypothetical protein